MNRIQKSQQGSQLNFQEFIAQLPDTVPGNGGDYIRQKQADGTYKYFVDTRSGSSYRPESDVNEWTDNALRYHGYLPQYDDDYENIIGMTPWDKNVHKQYMSEIDAVSNINNPNYKGPMPSGMRSHQTGGRFQDMSAREVFDLGHNPRYVEGLKSLQFDMTRGEGPGYNVIQGDSIGTDGSKWNVTWKYTGMNGEGVARRSAQEILPDGTVGRTERARSVNFDLRPEEKDVWGSMYPESTTNYTWTVDPKKKQLTKQSIYKIGGKIDYFKFYK